MTPSSLCLPKFGALGAFGIQGVDDAEDVPIGNNDIAYPAPADLAWQAVLAVP